MQLDKKITFVLYNSNNETVFVFPKNRRSDSLNDRKLNDLLDHFDINLKESDFTEIFSNENELVLLASIDSDSSTTNLEEWVAIQDLKTILSDNDLVLKSILNYFFRIDKFPKAQLSITLECSDKSILKNCKELIFQLNPGISSENRAGKLGIKIEDSNKEENSEVIHLSLNQQIINRPHVHNLLIEAEDSITEIYEKVMEVIANLYSQTVSKNVLYLPANFYGISGMTESGKSYYSKILDLKKHFWNLKIRSFIEYAKYLVDENISLLIEVTSIQLMIDFASYHYFKTSFVIESVYSKEFHDRLFQILNKNYHLIYIDTPEKERKLRSLDSDGDFIKKDLKKKKLGIPNLKEVADVIIDNSGTVSFSETQLNNYFQNQ